MAATCTVPSGTTPTIASAIANPTCTDIVLQATGYLESVTIGRSLSITGVSSTATIIVGRVRVEGAATVVSLNDLAVDAADPTVAGCWPEGVDSVDGARVTGANIIVTNATGVACLLFGDGFESGTTGGWSATIP
jgi:hypothetical protein